MRSLTRINTTDDNLKSFSQSNILETKFGKEKLENFLLCDLSHLYFYHYKCESVDDSNWGCAWRSLQSALRFQLSLNNQKKDISFYNLFMKYGAKNALIELYKKMSKDNDNADKNIDILSAKKFAPHENSCGWAEPFISQLVLYDFGFKGDLLLINGYPRGSYAPIEVFKKILNFQEFKEKLSQHFKQKNPGPIILDDSRASISIIGVKFRNDNNIELIIMDPHACPDAEKGLYIITLDNNGGFLEITPPEIVLASMSIYFAHKNPWMAYFPISN